MQEEIFLTGNLTPSSTLKWLPYQLHSNANKEDFNAWERRSFKSWEWNEFHFFGGRWIFSQKWHLCISIHILSWHPTLGQKSIFVQKIRFDEKPLKIQFRFLCQNWLFLVEKIEILRVNSSKIVNFDVLFEPFLRYFKI